VDVNLITNDIIGAAIEVHRMIGPGLLESVYKECLCREFELRGLEFELERPMRLQYKGAWLEAGYRLDLLVANAVVVEVKSVDAIHPVHEAQLMSYMRLGGWKVGLVLNFNVRVLKDGIRRKIIGKIE
jgi:GxxExxY protein